MTYFPATLPVTAEEVFTMAYSHVGLHIQYANDASMEYLYKAMPGVITWMDWSPNGIAALRRYRNNYTAIYNRAPTVIARHYEIKTLDVAQSVAILKSLPADAIDYYQLVNEPACTPELNTYTMGVMAACPTLKILVGCLAEGHPPNIPDIQYLIPALTEAKKRGGGLALHEYSKPRMYTDLSWHCCRFNRILEALPEQLRSIKVFITECGIDGGAVTTVSPIPEVGKGWRDYVTEPEYLEDIKWYSFFTKKTQATTYFNVGGIDWPRFELIGANSIADFIHAQQVIAPVPAKKLYLAICPSNQDYNTIMFNNTNERVQLALFASRVLAVSRTYPNVVCKVFTGAPESKDIYYLQGLKRQMEAAAEWLYSCPDGVKVMYNLHTDCGIMSHVGYYWWNQGHSRMLGAALCKRLETLFKTGIPPYNADYSDYVFCVYTRDVCTPLLIEVGSHQNAHDIAVLQDMGYLVARAIVEGTLAYFKPYL